MVIGGSPCNDLSLVNPARKGLYGKALCLGGAGHPRGVPGVRSHLKVQGRGSAPVCVGGGSPLSCKPWGGTCKAQAVPMLLAVGRAARPPVSLVPQLVPACCSLEGFLPSRRNREAVLRILPPAQLRPSQGRRGAPLLLDVRERGGHEGQRQEGHFSVSGGRDCCRLRERRLSRRHLLGCARCAETARVWLWFGMAPTLETPLQPFSLGSGSPLAFSRPTPSAGSPGEGFLSALQKASIRSNACYF